MIKKPTPPPNQTLPVRPPIRLVQSGFTEKEGNGLQLGITVTAAIILLLALACFLTA